MVLVPKVYALLPLLAFTLSGCSTTTLNVFNSTVKKAAIAKAVPTATVQAPSVAPGGFDSFAGNCPDAAAADATLITYASGQNYSFDMQLKINPIQNCDAEPKSEAYKSFIHQATKATLLLNSLDGNWVGGLVSTRDQFLVSMLTQLQLHYPSLSDATITLTYGGQTRATITWTGHGTPQVNDLYS